MQWSVCTCTASVYSHDSTYKMIARLLYMEGFLKFFHLRCSIGGNVLQDRMADIHSLLWRVKEIFTILTYSVEFFFLFFFGKLGWGGGVWK